MVGLSNAAGLLGSGFEAAVDYTLPAFWGLAVFLGAFCWSVERDARSLKTGFRPGWYGFIPPRD